MRRSLGRVCVGRVWFLLPPNDPSKHLLILRVEAHRRKTSGIKTTPLISEDRLSTISPGLHEETLERVRSHERPQMVSVTSMPNHVGSHSQTHTRRKMATGAVGMSVPKLAPTDVARRPRDLAIDDVN